MDRYLESFEVFCRVDAAGRWPKPVLMAVINSARKLQAQGQHEAALRGYMALREHLDAPGVDPFIVQCALKASERSVLGRASDASQLSRA